MATAVGDVATARVGATSVRDEASATEALLVFFVPSAVTAAGCLASDALLHLHDDGVLMEPLRRLVQAVGHRPPHTPSFVHE